MPRPNKCISALKKRDYDAAMWELLLHEYRCAKAGNSTNRLGPNAISSIISAIKDLEVDKKKEKEKKGSPSLEEIEEWMSETKN